MDDAIVWDIDADCRLTNHRSLRSCLLRIVSGDESRCNAPDLPESWTADAKRLDAAGVP